MRLLRRRILVSFSRSVCSVFYQGFALMGQAVKVAWTGEWDVTSGPFR
jgi:hypothetical protein